MFKHEKIQVVQCSLIASSINLLFIGMGYTTMLIWQFGGGREFLFSREDYKAE